MCTLRPLCVGFALGQGEHAAECAAAARRPSSRAAAVGASCRARWRSRCFCGQPFCLLTLMDSCAAERLTEIVHVEETAEALQLVWAEVVAGHEPGACIDYDACLAALGGQPS